MDPPSAYTGLLSSLISALSFIHAPRILCLHSWFSISPSLSLCSASHMNTHTPSTSTTTTHPVSKDDGGIDTGNTCRGEFYMLEGHRGAQTSLHTRDLVRVSPSTHVEQTTSSIPGHLGVVCCGPSPTQWLFFSLVYVAVLCSLVCCNASFPVKRFVHFCRKG